MTEPTRTARCACGALSVTVTGAPILVHTCSCQDCQRGSGSAFSYTAFFPSAAVGAVEGEYRTWRRIARSGRYDDTCFCLSCGSSVFGWCEGLPGVTKIAAGCFGDPDFPKPEKLCWSRDKPRWLTMPEGIAELETQ